MVEEKEQIRFKLRVTKRRMVEVVQKYLPEELGEIEEPFYKNLSFRSSEANRHGKLCFSTSLYCLCEATIAIYGGVPLMWFKRYDFDYDKWLDCGVYELDMEFLDLLGMLVRY